MTRRVAMLALIGALAPATASASTLRVGPSPPARFDSSSYGSQSVYYTAEPGEDNRVDVYYEPHGAFVQVNDLGADIHPQGSCHTVDQNSARCTVPSGSDADRITHTELRLGDGMDVLFVHPPNDPIGGVTAFGGAGNDNLEGAEGGDDELFGGDGTDRLDGQGGDDRVYGGDGDDFVQDGDRIPGLDLPPPGPDVIDGGDGRDLVEYNRGQDLTVDLKRRTGGERGEGDAVTEVEDVTTGSGDDRILGTAGRNVLRSGHGDDVVKGRGGDGDELRSGAGRDRVVGGSGPDLLHPGKGRDSVACGRGRDRVFNPAAGELLRRACEAAEWTHAFGPFDYGVQRYPGRLAFSPHAVSVSRHGVKFSFPCPTYFADHGAFRPCSGRISIHAGRSRHGRLLGRARFSRRSRRASRRVRIRLNGRGRALIQRPRGVVATVAIDGLDTASYRGDPPRIAWTVRLRR